MCHKMEIDRGEFFSTTLMGITKSREVIKRAEKDGDRSYDDDDDDDDDD